MMRERSGAPSLPGPRPTPILGWHGPLRAFARDPLLYTRQLWKTYGSLAAIRQDTAPIVCVFDHELTRCVFEDPAFVAPSDLPSSLAIWSEQQRRAYAELIVVAATRIVDRWWPGHVVDTMYVMQRILVQSAVAAVAEGASDDQHEHALHRWLADWGQRLAMPNSLFPLMLPRWQRAQPEDIPEDPHAFWHHFGVVPVRQNAQKHQLFVTRDDLGFLWLSYVWSSLVFSWTLLLLSQHVGVLNDVIAEVRTTFGAVAPSVDLVERLPLLHGVVMESMRLLPPMALSYRRSTASVVMGSYTLPGGAQVIYSPYLLQRSQHIYFAPDRFRPQRWSQIEAEPWSFLPLGAEPAARVMQPFILMQLKLVLATILQRYQLAPEPGEAINRQRTLMLAPRNDVRMIITPVDRPMPKREVHGMIRDVITFP